MLNVFKNVFMFSVFCVIVFSILCVCVRVCLPVCVCVLLCFSMGLAA